MDYKIFRYPDHQDPWLRPAIDLIDFPWDKLVPGLVRQVGRSYIPLQLSDLSRYAGIGPGASHDHHQAVRAHGTDTHESPSLEDVAHPIEYRNRVLGLYWLSVRIEIEQTLTSQPMLLTEVLGSEVAHAVDYAMLTTDDQKAIAAALHPEGPDSHTWWEVRDYAGEYPILLGETFMEVFCRAFAPSIPISMHLAHKVTPEAIAATIAILTPERTPAPPPSPSPQPEPAVEADDVYGHFNSKIFHDDHRKIRREVVFGSYVEAVAAGRRPCKVCKPQP